MLAVIEFHISCACFCKVMLIDSMFVLLCNYIEVIWSAVLEFVINLVVLFRTRCLLLIRDMLQVGSGIIGYSNFALTERR